MRIIALSSLAILIFSCSPNYVRLYKTKSDNSISTDSTYKYENDSVLINYSFWYNKGIMAFSVYNKLNVPLYIDWKRSSFISNIYKFNYWFDEEVTGGVTITKSIKNTSSESASYGGLFRHSGPLIIPYLSASAGNSITSSTSASTFASKKVKPERITFIPPKSIIYMSPYYLTENDYNDKSNSNLSTEVRADQRKKKTTIYTKQFSKLNTPLVFRNFMTISTTENFTKEAYIDNEFFVSEIKFIDKRHFDKWILDSKGNSIYINKFMKGVDFYRIPGFLSSSN